MDTRFLKALHKNNSGRPPVWLMRQAGRFLPEYRALRTKYSLFDLFFTPNLAADVTMMPLERFGVDAAILFSDITAIAPALGLNLQFDEGPIITPVLQPKFVLNQLNFNALNPIFETVRLVKQRAKVPLIGFCGGPFTVASYFVERHNGTAMERTMSWIKNDLKEFYRLLDTITDLSIAYVQEQIAAGADAIQIFDSWANVLGDERKKLCYPFLKRIVSAVNKPVIVFMRGSSDVLQEIETTGCTAVSIDTGDMRNLRQQTRCVLQGNLNPDLLFQPIEQVREAVVGLLEQMRDDPGFIVNLGHGVKVGTPVEAVAALVEEVKAFR